jgi:hypothetical protein
MKIEKYIFCFGSANHRASKRTGIPPLTNTQLRYLYALRRLGTISQVGLSDYVYGFRTHVIRRDNRATWNELDILVRRGLAIREKQRYTITTLGREYISHIRNYLLNKRL